MTDKQERFECMDCDYIGNKKSLQEHVISSGMTHKMKPTPTTPSQWEKDWKDLVKVNFGNEDYFGVSELETHVETLGLIFIHQTLQQERQLWIAELEGMEFEKFEIRPGKKVKYLRRVAVLKVINGEKE